MSWVFQPLLPAAASLSQPPSITGPWYYNVEHYFAEIGCTISPAGTTASEYGFVWSDQFGGAVGANPGNVAPESSGYIWNWGTTDGAPFSGDLYNYWPGLAPNTTYYLRYYIISSGVYYYSDEISFTTLNRFEEDFTNRDVLGDEWLIPAFHSAMVLSGEKLTGNSAAAYTHAMKGDLDPVQFIDQYVSGTIGDITAGAYSWLCSRTDATVNTKYAFGVKSDGTWTLNRFNSGSETVLDSGTYGTGFATGDEITLFVWGLGTVELLCFVNSVPIADIAVDSSANRITAGYPGWMVYGTGNSFSAVEYGTLQGLQYYAAGYDMSTGVTDTFVYVGGIQPGTLVAIWLAGQSWSGNTASCVSYLDAEMAYCPKYNSPSGGAVGQWFYTLAHPGGSDWFHLTISGGGGNYVTAVALEWNFFFVAGGIPADEGVWALIDEAGSSADTGTAETTGNFTGNEQYQGWMAGEYNNASRSVSAWGMGSEELGWKVPPDWTQSFTWSSDWIPVTNDDAYATLSGSAAWVCAGAIFSWVQSQQQISIGESGSGADALALSAALSAVESGSGADTLGLSAALSVADSGAGADVLSIAQQIAIALADSGSGADTLSILAAALLQDSGTGADAVALLASLPILDGGSGADAIAMLQAALALAESGAGLDALFLAISELKSLADSGSGADVISVISAAMALSDSGTGADVIAAISSALSIADAGSGLDAVALIEAALSLLESGVGVDTLELLITVFKALEDSGGGADAISTLQAALSIVDAGSGSDVVSLLNAFVALQDAGVGEDTISLIQALLAMQDAGAGVDTLASVVALILAETGSGADDMSVEEIIGIIYKELADSGSGADVLSAISAALGIVDSGSGTDLMALASALSIGESGSGVDAISVLASLSIADSGAGVDAVIVYVPISIVDAGSGLDALILSGQISIADGGAGVDLLGLLGQIAIADEAAGIDTLVLVVSIPIAISDGGVGEDSISIEARVALADLGHEIDAMLLQGAVVIVDAGSGIERMMIPRLASARDTYNAMARQREYNAAARKRSYDADARKREYDQ